MSGKYDTYSHRAVRPEDSSLSEDARRDFQTVRKMLETMRKADLEAFFFDLEVLKADEARCFGCGLFRNSPWVGELPFVPVCEMHQYRRRILAFPP